MEASTEQSAQSIHPAKLSLGTAPDAHVSREAQGKLPLTGTIAPFTLHTVPDYLLIVCFICFLLHLKLSPAHRTQAISYPGNQEIPRKRAVPVTSQR